MLVLRRHKEVCRSVRTTPLGFRKNKVVPRLSSSFLLSYLQRAEKYKVARQIERYAALGNTKKYLVFGKIIVVIHLTPRISYFMYNINYIYLNYITCCAIIQ